MRHFKHMTWTDRLIIEKLYNSGHTYRFISEQIGFAESSVYREIKHGLYPHMGAEVTSRPFHYSAKIAQDYADIQATAKGMPLKLGHNYEFCHIVHDRVKQGRSVAHIVSELRLSNAFHVSISTLYRYIDRGYIPHVTNKDLPEKSRRIKQSYKKVRAVRAPKGLSIEKRPQIINTRSTFGHWELDSVIGKSQGKNQSILVLTERMTRYQLICKVRSKTSASTVHALDSTLSKFPQGTFKTLIALAIMLHAKTVLELRAVVNGNRLESALWEF